MYTPHQVFLAPSDDNQVIWRYMSLSKFTSMLISKSLYFANAESFDDIFEGSLSKSNIDYINKNFNKIPNHASSVIKSIAGFKKHMYINCWHMNDYESEAMWKLYLESDEGIAIRSTYANFVSAFNESKEDICIGTIQYIDYEKDYIDMNNSFSPFMCKRYSFEHERELRAIYSSFDLENAAPPHGYNVRVDLDKLIDAIYISPKASSWFKTVVSEISRKFDLNKPIEHSNLAHSPYT